MGAKHQRVCWTRNKRQLMVLAYPHGMRPHDSASVLLPSVLGLIWSARELVDYYRARRGSWVVEIRDPNSEHAFATRAVPDETTAIALLDPVRDRLTKVYAIDDEQARQIFDAE